MTNKKFKAVRASTGLTFEGFAHLLRMHDPTGRTVRRWEDGASPIPGYVSLFCELLELPEVRAHLLGDKAKQRRHAA